MSEYSCNFTNAEAIVEKFQRNGFVLIENFLPQSAVDELYASTLRLIDNNQDIREDNLTIFEANTDQQSVNDYFLQSSSKINYFFEKNSTNSSGIDLRKSLNKIGHCLHWLNDSFREFTFENERVKHLAKTIGLRRPLVVQSMIIFKNPEVSTPVPEHQDATFLYSTPERKVVGFWLPLKNATVENGCLEFVPGSHRTHPLTKRWIRRTNPADGRIDMEFVERHYWYDRRTNDDDLIKSTAEYVPIPAPKGSCLLIDGLVLHRSDINRTNESRPVYTFHVFDQGIDNERQWDPLNWLQPTEDYSFPNLYDGSSQTLTQ